MQKEDKMCQTHAYLLKDGEEQEIMRDVLYMDVHEDGISMRGFLAPTKKVAARIVKIDLEHHKILLEPFWG